MTNTDKDKFTTMAYDDDFRNDYAFCTTWAEILEPHGWIRLRSDTRGALWEPPGRSGYHTPGAALTREYGPLTVFTTSTEFEAGTPYCKFDAYAVLNHDGDTRAAAEALHGQGFGVFRERDSDGNQIVRCGRYSYTWSADREPLAVGDIVELPHQCLHPYAKRMVTSQDKPRSLILERIISGPLVQVVRLVTRASPDDPGNPDDIDGSLPQANTPLRAASGKDGLGGNSAALVQRMPRYGRLTAYLISPERWNSRDGAPGADPLSRSRLQQLELRVVMGRAEVLYIPRTAPRGPHDLHGCRTDAVLTVQTYGTGLLYDPGSL